MQDIENKDLLLPKNWPNFLALSDNKVDLARFLSQHLVANAPLGQVIVVAGGFTDGEEAQSSSPEFDTSVIYGKHEEADTRLVLYSIANACETVVVLARDTDVLLLLIAHSPNIPCANLWMMTWAATKLKYFNIRAICANLPPGSISALLPFHTLTGCDTTS